MSESAKGLWVPPPGFNINRFHARTRTITLPNGERAKVTIDDSGTVLHRERDEGLDAIVRPKTIRFKLKKGGVHGTR